MPTSARPRRCSATSRPKWRPDVEPEQHADPDIVWPSTHATSSGIELEEHLTAPDFDLLVAAIRNEPDDDAPRLVLSDYLLECGDPRGELIQIQCRLAAGRDDDPGRSVLVDRERELLSKHRPPQGCWVRYRRGFADEVEVTSDDDATVAFLANEPLVTKLRISWRPSRMLQVVDSLVRKFALTLRTLEFTDVRSNWEENSPTSAPFDRDTITRHSDGSRSLEALLASLPCPQRLVALHVPEDIVVPDRWPRSPNNPRGGSSS